MSFSSWEENRPEPEEYGDFYKGYIDLVTSPNVLQSLIKQGQEIYSLLQNISDEEADYRYEEGKWSVKEIFGHLVDTERIMAYRALCISRGEQTTLPGYDHEAYVKQANFQNRSIQDISVEYDALRNANISMFNSFTDTQIVRQGIANDVTVSVRALAYIIAGHERHHLNILDEKYDLPNSLGGLEK
jgi:uncharacterized damage-inducible protein DinB